MVSEVPCKYYVAGRCRAPLDTNPKYRQEWEDRSTGFQDATSRVCMNPRDSEKRRCQEDVLRQERDNYLMGN